MTLGKSIEDQFAMSVEAAITGAAPVVLMSIIVEVESIVM
jgi:hypothetical protein